jgi:hypothetical protein
MVAQKGGIMKYIIVRDREEKESAIVFPNRITHREVARIHSASGTRVVSAGFCQIGDQVHAWGESESTGLKSRPEDTAIIGADFSS